MPVVTVSSEDFSRAVSLAKNVVAGRTTLPLYESVLISAKDGTMRVAATSADHAVETAIPCQGDGAWLLSHARLSSFVGAIQKGKPVTITGDSIAALRCGSVSARIGSLAPEDFPAFSNRPEWSAHPTWETASFPAILSRLAMCCDDRPNAPQARAVHVKISGTTGRAVGATGFILARQNFSTDAPCDVELAIDMATAPVVSALFPKGPLWVAQVGKTLWVKGNGTTYHSKTVDAQLQEAVTKLEFMEGETITADMDGITRALKSAQSVAEGKERAVYLNVSEVGSFIGGRDDHSALCVPFDTDGEGKVSGFYSADQLRRVLGACAAETIQFGWRETLSNGTGHPHLVFKGAGFFALAMPLKSNAAEAAEMMAAWGSATERAAA